MYAADILDLYYADNEENTIEFLEEKSVLYHDQQPLTLIDDLCSKTLVSTKCMQSYMNTVWYGDQFHTNKNFIWEILVISKEKKYNIKFIFIIDLSCMFMSFIIVDSSYMRSDSSTR